MTKLIIPILAFITTTLTACAPFHLSDPRAPYCNELNSRIILDGNTTYTRNREIADAQQTLMQHSYDKHCQRG